MFHRVGGMTARHPWLILTVWLAVGLVLAMLAPSWDKSAQDDDIHFLPDRCPSVRGYHLLKSAFPQDVYASKLVFALERPDAPLSEADFSLVDGMVSRLAELRDREPELQIKKILSQRDPMMGSRLRSEDGHCTLVQVSLATPYLALKTRAAVDRADQVVREYLATQQGDLPQVHTTGPAGVGRDLISAGGASLDSTTIATVLLVIIILLGVYRSPMMALIPLMSIAIAVWIALNILAMCTLIPGFYLVNISAIFAIVMLYGAGTDYCLFLISRYREELVAGKQGLTALIDSVGGVGEAIAASAATTICGLGLMALAEFAKVRCGGPAIAVSLGVALLATLTLTPALLALVGRFAFWPVGIPKVAATEAESEGLWGWISHRVMERPIAIGLTSFALLVPLALLGLNVKPSYRATAELSPSSSSVLGLEAISRHFTPGELGPITLLLESDQPWDNAEGRSLIRHLSVGFGVLPNVAEVRSLTQPLGQPLPESHPQPSPAKAGFLAALVNKMSATIEDRVQSASRAHYLSNNDGKHVTRLDVVLRTDPFDPESAQTLEVIQTWAEDAVPLLATDRTNLRTETYGITVSSKDMATVTESDRHRINWMVVVGVFLILLCMVRHLGLTAYLLFTVLVSYYATLGATMILAHYGHGRPFGEVDWRVPFFLFTILVAVGEDYNIFLLSRAMQEKKKYGGREGLRRGLAHTGGTITSCGLIMAGTFATLMLAGLNTLVQVGFALAFGVLLDTFLVRPFLVPAFTLWIWKDEEATPPPAVPEPAPVEPQEELYPRIIYRRAG
jgi:RND superfamily putative drug exporter